ncbi:MAG: hypothetical protein ACI9UU_002798 [Candidatus Azotimanducaceae bacterium]|jgi:hypothetical protein
MLSKKSARQSIGCSAHNSVDTAGVEFFTHGAMRRRLLAHNLELRISNPVSVDDLHPPDALPVETRMADTHHHGMVLDGPAAKRHIIASVDTCRRAANPCDLPTNSGVLFRDGPRLDVRYYGDQVVHQQMQQFRFA